MPIPQPWLADSLEQLDLRQHDRCLMLGCPTDAHLSAVAEIVGRQAAIVVVEPDTGLAENAARSQHQHLEVLAYTPGPGDRLGSFDALLACPLTTMDWSLMLWTKLIGSNLRPGGRFVLDLPAEHPCEPLRRAWDGTRGDPDGLARLCGPSEQEIADALREHGLRNVEASLGTHLLRLESPYALAHLVRGLSEDATEVISDLERRLIEVLQTTDQVDVVFHRTRVHGLR